MVAFLRKNKVLLRNEYVDFTFTEQRLIIAIILVKTVFSEIYENLVNDKGVTNPTNGIER